MTNIDVEDVLEPFEGEVVERNAIWKNPGRVPRMEVRHHRNGSTTRVLVRSDTTADARGVTVHFSAAEWRLLEQAVLGGLGLGRIE